MSVKKASTVPTCRSGTSLWKKQIHQWKTNDIREVYLHKNVNLAFVFVFFHASAVNANYWRRERGETDKKVGLKQIWLTICITYIRLCIFLSRPQLKQQTWNHRGTKLSSSIRTWTKAQLLFTVPQTASENASACIFFRETQFPLSTTLLIFTYMWAEKLSAFLRIVQCSAGTKYHCKRAARG